MSLIIVAILVLIWGYYTGDSRTVLAGIAIAITGVAAHHFRHQLRGSWAEPLTHGGMSREAEQVAMDDHFGEPGYSALASVEYTDSDDMTAQLQQVEQADRESRREMENVRSDEGASSCERSREMMAKLGVVVDCP